MAAPNNWETVLSDAPKETTELVVNLQLEEIDAMESEGPDTEPDLDSAAAVHAYQEELKQVGAEVPAAQAAPHPGPGQEHQETPQVDCAACTVSFPVHECCQVPCGHHYCGGCLTLLYEQAMGDPRSWPVSCCERNVPNDDVEGFLGEDIKKKFEAKKAELDDPHAKFCYVSGCASYIAADQRQDGVGNCSACTAKTCLTCDGAAHEGDCPADGPLHEVLRIAEKEGWRRCNECKQMVELTIGCYHMMYVFRAMPQVFYTDTTTDASALRNSAISAVHRGRLVRVRNSQSDAYSILGSRSMLKWPEARAHPETLRLQEL